jgi:alpha-ketoglutarate-dependent taurine dioxygenase
MYYGDYRHSRKWEDQMSAASKQRQASELTITPQEPRIGAEVGGIDLQEPLSPELRERLKELLVQYKVLFFRNQFITREQHLAFGKTFGELTVHPLVRADGSAEIQNISAKQFREYRTKNNSGRRYDNGWHSDETFREVPPYASILRAIELPSLGGDTVFTNAAAAYEGLPEEVKQRIDGLKAVHSASRGFGSYADSEKQTQITEQFPPVEHPVVRVHPDSGAKILFVNSVFTSHIVGLRQDESDWLLALLTYQFTRPEYQVRFKWQEGSIAFWDNRSTQHYAVRDYGDAGRELERVTIKGQAV